MTIAPIILVADRDEEAAKYLREVLTRTDYQLFHVKDGQEVLSIVDKHPAIVFAIIELELPSVNGLSLIGRLNGRDPKPEKIIATTFLNDDLIFEIAMHMGADAIVQKPRPERTWVGKLRRLLPEPARNEASRIDGGPQAGLSRVRAKTGRERRPLSTSGGLAVASVAPNSASRVTLNGKWPSSVVG